VGKREKLTYNNVALFNCHMFVPLLLKGREYVSGRKSGDLFEVKHRRGCGGKPQLEGGGRS